MLRVQSPRLQPRQKHCGRAGLGRAAVLQQWNCHVSFGRERVRVVHALPTG